MRTSVKSTVAQATIIALVSMVAVVPSPTVAADGAQARLEGLLVDLDGRAAENYRIHLIDGKGQTVTTSTTDARGLYSFVDLVPGEYALGIENPEGQVAPVVSAPVRVAKGQLARRDVKLMEADPATAEELMAANFGGKAWWNGLSAAQKGWLIAGAVIVGATTYAVIDNNNDDDEMPAS